MRYLGVGTHVEKCKGTPLEAAEYCRKSETAVEGTLVEWGTIVAGQGHRTDLEKAFSEVVSLPYLDFVEANKSAWCRYRRCMDEYKALKVGTCGKRNKKTIVVLLYGVTGSGKSHYVHQNYPEAFWLRRGNCGNVWFDGYNADKVCVLDDFYGWCSIDFMLRLMDKYPLRVDKKGGCCEFVSEMVFITSNVHSNEWYKKISPEVCAALDRRIYIRSYVYMY